MKKSQQMWVLLNALIAESKTLIDKEGVTSQELSNKADEIARMKAKIAIQEEIEAQEKEELEANEDHKHIVAGLGAMGVKDDKSEYAEAFFNVITGKAVTAEQQELLGKFKNALSSGTAADGGYLIPADQQVEVRKLMRQFASIADLVTVENVTTLTGSRNIEVDAEHTPLGLLAENGTIQEFASPTFANVTYAIKTYAGMLTVPNNLMADASVLLPYLNAWLAKKLVATRNYLIVTALNTLSKTPVTGIDNVKTILNKTLDPAIADGSTIIMNQDSYNLFDQMKDKDDKYLLQPSPTDPTKLLLAGKTVKVYSNRLLPTRSATVGEVTTKYAPVIVGDLKQVVTVFDRQAPSIASTNIGAGTFETNTTKFRLIDRLDVVKFDTAAVVFGEIVVA